MCLEVTLTPSALAKASVGAARLASASGLVVESGQNNLGKCLHFSATGGCGCDLLARKAKDVTSWELSSESAEKLAVAVALYGKEAKSFTFQSRWLGEEVAEPKRIKLAELLEEIRENRVPKNTPLLVGSHP
jgi:hypothetical protein